MENKLRIFRKFLVLAVLLVGMAFVVNDGNSTASAALCCSYCDQQDFEICIRKPDAAICQACYSCNPQC